MKDIDRQKRELIDLKNEADTTIHTTEKSLSEHKDNIKSEVAEEVQVEINNLRNIMSEADVTVD